ncbi:hypothetical protein G3I39_24770 [Streptomyces fulvissimus]|uniref:Uncharacterized protein n=1 Tax=Streptomyces microflavus TaxID=1919 RepID=A0A6N9VJI6_STRMI|nr:hypothetical protein [Streptomyces microflavus]NEB70241.1 hypothetical protein [Streptomyces microflavus]NEE50006.1 hypothetical protein [Streptomyces sp. SID8455]
MTADIERLDVPLPVLIAQVDAITAANDSKRAAEATAENRHLLYDADPDATVPAFVDLHHHTTTRRGNR